MINVREWIRSLDLATLFRWFIIYSIFGWKYETVYCCLVNGVMTERGFLFEYHR